MIDLARTKEIFTALSLHFTSNYDYTKFNGKLRFGGNPKQTEFWYGRVAGRLLTEERVFQFYLSNIIDGYVRDGRIDKFAGHYWQPEKFAVWNDWKAKIDGLTYKFEQELKTLNLKKDMAITDGIHPNIFKKYLRGEIQIETVCCLAIADSRLLDYWRSKTNDPILFVDFCNVVEKYKPFLTVKKTKLVEIINKNISET